MARHRSAVELMIVTHDGDFPGELCQSHHEDDPEIPFEVSGVAYLC